MRVICDIETDSLTPTKVWCIVCKDIDTGEYHDFIRHSNLDSFRAFADDVTEWWGHNFLSFDAPALNRLLGTRIKISEIQDTLILSRMFSVYRQGGHSLAAWGRRLRCPKGGFTDFSQYSEEMLEYCRQDVAVTDLLRKQLLREGRGFKKRAIRLEHDFQYVINQQMKHGFVFDEEKAHALYLQCKGEADELEGKIQEFFPAKYVAIRQNKKSTAVELRPFNLASPKQIVERLEPYWSPRVRTKSGQSWKVCEENLETLNDGVPESVKSLATWLTLNNRVKMLANWIEHTGKDGRIHGNVISCGASTHRCAHSGPNTANIPALVARTGKVQLYGKECRELWGVGNNSRSRLLGTDAAGIQLRVLAHFINHPDYTHEVVNGDIHTKNMEAMEGTCKSREAAKTFIYAWLLGAGVAKVAEILDCTKAEAAVAIDKFVKNIPGLADFLVRKKYVAQRGYLKLFDGRRIPVPSDYLALSIYLQGGEQAIMKKANVLWYKEATKAGIDFKQCAFVHDEWQTEVDKDQADELGKIQVAAIIKAGEIFNLNCPMDGEYNIGLNWAETH